MKNVVNTILFIFISVSVLSQTPDVKKTTIGIYAGGNVSSLLTDSLSNTKARIGYQYGGFFRYGNKVFFSTDIALYSMSSQLVDATDTALIIGGANTIEDKIDLQFLHFPIHVGYKIFKSPDGTSAVWISAGAYLDQIFKVKLNDLGLAKSDFRTTSFGLVGSAGIDLWFLTFQLNYHHGLTPIFKVDDNSLKYNVSFSAGIKF